MVSSGFQMVFKGFQMVFKGFSIGFQRVSKGFHRVSKGVKGFPRVFKGSKSNSLKMATKKADRSSAVESHHDGKHARRKLQPKRAAKVPCSEIFESLELEKKTLHQHSEVNLASSFC